METAKTVAAKIAEWKRAGFSKAQIIQNAAACCIGWPYVWASNGERCTPGWRKNRIHYCREQKYADAIRNNCSVLSGNREQCAGCKWDGCLCFDCQGFDHWILEQVGVPLYGGGATTQWNTATNWAAKGEIATMPRGLVCCVYKRKDNTMSHAGMSMGDGNGGAIHCSTTVKRGNVFTDTPKWTHWGIPKGLYSTEELRKAGLNVDESRNVPTLRRGNNGESVKELKELLNEKHGAELKVDGNFGKATEAAVKAFQQAHGLTVDGIVGPKTWAALGVRQEAKAENTDASGDEAGGNAQNAGENAQEAGENAQKPENVTIPRLKLLELQACLIDCQSIVRQYLKGEND